MISIECEKEDTFLFSFYLRSEVERSGNPDHVGPGHPPPDLFAELSDVRAGRVQVLQEHSQAGRFLTRSQEGPQAGHLHGHAVQSAVGKLDTRGRHLSQKSYSATSGAKKKKRFVFFSRLLLRYLNVVGQLDCAVFGVLGQVDAVELLNGNLKKKHVNFEVSI